MSVLTRDALTNNQVNERTSMVRSPDVLNWIGNTVRLWRTRIRERHSFDFADEHELRELGLSRWDVEREIAKPFWRE